MDDQKAKKLCSTTKDKSLKTESESEKINSKIQDLTYDVLRIIFKFLNGKDLSAAAMVCRYYFTTKYFPCLLFVFLFYFSSLISVKINVDKQFWS